MPAPLSTMRTTHTLRRGRRALRRGRIRNGIECVVDQIYPDLIQLAREPAHARKIRFDFDGNRADLLRAFDLSTATVFPETLDEVDRFGDRVA